MDKNLDLNKSRTLPESDCGTEGATNGAEVSDAALERGYTKIGLKPQSDSMFGPRTEDDDGSTYVGGDPRDKGGFCGRPQGWEH